MKHGFLNPASISVLDQSAFFVPSIREKRTSGTSSSVSSVPLCFKTNNAEFLAEFSLPFLETQRHRGVIATDYCKGTSIFMPEDLRKQTNFETNASGRAAR